MTVFVKNSDAAFWHNVAKFFDQQRLVIDKRDNPAAPGEIVVDLRQITFHQIDFVNLYVCERASTADCLQRANEVLRTFQCYHFTGWSDDLSQINGCVAGTGSGVEHAFANGDAGALPAIQHNRSSDSRRKR